MYKLVISDDEGKTIIVPLVRDLITIGRQEGNTIRLTERNVSRQHARLVKVSDHFRLEDLDAYTGVRVNDERIQGSRDLANGDRIGIGDYGLVLRLEEDVAATTKRQSHRPAPPAASVAQPARLVMVSAPAPGAEFSLNKDAVRVGRLEELDLCISHRSISREHAEIERTDSGFRVEDLDSANGVRINGALVKKGALKSGDLLDLGQVRFRFVGPGEAYTFDADEIHTMTEPTLPMASHRLRTVLIVGGAVLVAVALAFWSEDDSAPDTMQVQAEPIEASEVVTSGNTDSSEVTAQVMAALSGCRESVAAARYDEGVKSAQNGLMLDEQNRELVACRDQAREGERELAAFRQGEVAFKDGDVDAAYLLFAGLSPESALRDQPVVAQVIEAYGRGQLNEAQEQLSADADEAARIASEVAAIDGISEALKAEAVALQQRADEAEPLPQPARPARRVRQRQRQPDPRPRKTATRRAKPDEPKPPDDGLMLAESPAKMARSCLARGDQKCAVRALEGRARTAQELALLIETYRALGDTKRAVRSMQQFVKRYPSAPQAEGYEAFIARNGQ